MSTPQMDRMQQTMLRAFSRIQKDATDLRKVKRWVNTVFTVTRAYNADPVTRAKFAHQPNPKPSRVRFARCVRLAQRNLLNGQRA